MAKSVIPEFIGRVRGAERNVRYVPTNEGRALQEAGKAISGAGKMALKGLGVMAELADERYRAEYSKALMEAEAEAGRRFDEEVKKRVGFDAVGAAQRAQQIYAEVGAKYRPSIAERYQDKFDLAWGKHSNGQFRVATDFEFRNVRQANLDAETAIMTGARDRAAAAMDPEAQIEAWDEMTEAYNRRFKIINGRLITPESLQKFDADVNDGNNVVTIGGKKLTIVDDGNEAKEGTISRSRIKEIRAAMETQAKAYEKGLTDQYDLSHASIIDGLLKADRIEEAREHLEELKQRTVPASDKAISKFEEAISRHEEVRLIKTSAGKYVADAVAAGAEVEGDGSYGGPEQDYAFAKAIAKEKNPRIVARARQMYELTKRKQAAKLQIDTIDFIKQNLQPEGPDGKRAWLPMPEQKAKIDALADGPLKDELMSMWQKREANARKFERLQTDRLKGTLTPESIAFEMAQQAALLNLMDAIDAGEVRTQKGEVRPLDTPDKMVGYAASLGLQGEFEKKARDYILDAAGSVSPREVRELLPEYLGRSLTKFDNDNWVPKITWLLNLRKGNAPLGKGPDRIKWLKDNMTEVLASSISNRNSFVDTSGAIKGYINDGEDEFSDYYFSKNQLKALRNDTNEARKALFRRGLKDEEFDRLMSTFVGQNRKENGEPKLFLGAKQ